MQVVAEVLLIVMVQVLLQIHLQLQEVEDLVQQVLVDQLEQVQLTLAVEVGVHQLQGE